MTQWNLVARATPGHVSTSGLETDFYRAVGTEDGGVTITDVQNGDAPGWFYVNLSTAADSEADAREQAINRLLGVTKAASEWRQNSGVNLFLDEAGDDPDDEVFEIQDFFTIDSADKEEAE